MMENCKIKVVDALMGQGKTSAAINYINEMSEDERVIYITPYKAEVKRIIDNCKSKKIKEPKEMGTKLKGIKYLISKGSNIVSTHALFGRFDKEVIDMCIVENYTLILDEVASVIDRYDELIQEDINTLLEKYVDVNPDTGILEWRESESHYGENLDWSKINWDSRERTGKGRFLKEKILCDLGCLALYGGQLMMWLFPVKAFEAFKKIYILTYMFDAQIQRYYYDFYKENYEYIGICGDSPENYRFCALEDANKNERTVDYRKLIHVLDNDKLNEIGDNKESLSKSWYYRNIRKDNPVLKKLKNNTVNYFIHIRKGTSSQNMWTTFSEYQKDLSGGGYSKGFLPLNVRAINSFRERINIAYLVNRYLNPVVKNFFMEHNVTVDDDGYALSEMLQFIWRSAIREGNEIWIYVPSYRMRRLLLEWIEENSPKIVEIAESDESIDVTKIDAVPTENI